ncbi:hypothetical protein SAY87_000829 [Trapa incisa]|uniref:DYW domain-containing protein n=1 Tax=Trapa incisa TaxID=236973 RepID=A0AAN7GF62_9MYRT|nr:hypothetical protein SAY87_000829 [Trapa incisa]
MSSLSLVCCNSSISLLLPDQFRRRSPNVTSLSSQIRMRGALKLVAPPISKAPPLPSKEPPNISSFIETPFLGALAEAFKSLRSLLRDECSHRVDVYSQVLDFCTSNKALAEGQQIHSHVVKCVPDSYFSIFLNTKLVFMYGKCGCVHAAEKLFDKMTERTIFTWNAMIGTYVSNADPIGALELYGEMRNSGFFPDPCTFALVLKASSAMEDLPSGAEVHGLAIKSGYISIVFVANALITMYAKCNDLYGARRLFDSMNDKDIVTWNSIISAYSATGIHSEALNLFRDLQRTGHEINTYTVVATLQACEDSKFQKLGSEIHAFVLKSSHTLDIYVANALVSMYLRCRKMNIASRIFYKMENRDNISWNSILSGSVQNGLYSEALQLFRDMQEEGTKPDLVSITNVISACGRIGNLLLGKETHAYAVRRGLDCVLQVGNTLIDLYNKCFTEKYMVHAFDRILAKDRISWTTIIAGYTQNGFYGDAISFFREVVKNGMEVDEFMIGSILLACSGVKSMNYMKEAHCFILRKGIIDLVLQNSLVDSYGECKNIDYAAKTFRFIQEKDIVSWTSMISSYVQNGYPNEAFSVFFKMMEAGVDADPITLISILSAAAALSVARKGKEIHGYLFRKGFSCEGPIASSLVDMYARCGDLKCSFRVFTSVKSKDVILWTSMINANGMHGRGLAAVSLFHDMVNDNKLIPDEITFLSILYACSHSGMISEGKRFIEIMTNDFCLEPWPEHYTCLVDLLGRANRLDEAYEYIQMMPFEPTAEVWCSLLGACRIHSNKKLGEIAAGKLLALVPENPGNYILVSNLFASSGRWKDVKNLRTGMKGRRLTKNPGCSWIEVENKVHSFIARDKSHPHSEKIYQKLGEVAENLAREVGYIPDTKFVLHNVEEEKKVQMIYGHSERLAIAYGLLETPEGSPIRVTKNLRICGDCHTFCKLVSKVYRREVVIRDASRFHHFDDGVCSCGDYY